MAEVYLGDEAAADRARVAEEFLDPRMYDPAPSD